MEIVKLIAKGTIDDWMHDLQERKSKKISEYISEKNLMQLDTLKELLAGWGDINEADGGGYLISWNGK